MVCRIKRQNYSGAVSIFQRLSGRVHQTEPRNVRRQHPTGVYILKQGKINFLAFSRKYVINKPTYKECARDKPDDHTATGKRTVLKLGR